MMLAAITVEWLKLRRSRIFQITTVLVGIGCPRSPPASSPPPPAAQPDTPWPSGQRHAHRRRLVRIPRHAAQILSVMSFLGVGFVVAWCFGREFTDRTITGLYALPTSRSHYRRRQVHRPARLVPGPQLRHPGRRIRPRTAGRLSRTHHRVLLPAAKVLFVGLDGALWPTRSR